MMIKEYTGFLDEKAKEKKKIDRLTKNMKDSKEAVKKETKKGDK